jgi:hypothetical protein
MVIASVAWMTWADHALAHPGHGLDATDVGLLHFLLEPSHGGTAALLAVIALAVVVFAHVHRRRQE